MGRCNCRRRGDEIVAQQDSATRENASKVPWSVSDCPIHDFEAAPESSPSPAETLLVQLSRAEGHVLALEGAFAHLDARAKALGAALAAIRAFAYERVLVQPPTITAPAPVAVPPIDEVTRAKARRALARGGFMRMTP